MSPKKATQKSAKNTTASGKKLQGFTDEERAAMKERVKELKAETRGGRRADKFKARYATFGFSDTAHLDEGALWPVAFALKELTAAEEARIGALVKKAVS